MNVLESAWKTNLEVREEYDWEKMEGRAISKNIDKVEYKFIFKKKNESKIRIHLVGWLQSRTKLKK